MGKLTQGDYRFKNKIAGSKKRIQKLFTSEENRLLEKYEIVCQRCAKPLTMDKAILLESETQQQNEKLENRIDKLEMLLTNQLQDHLKNPEAIKALKDVLKKDNSCFTAG